MSTLLLSLLTFVAVSLGVAGTYSILADLFLRDRKRINGRIDDEFRRKLRDRAKSSSLFRNLDQIVVESKASRDDRKTISQRFAALVEQSGLDLTPRKLLAIAGIVGLVLALPCGLLRRSPLWALGGFAIGSAAPILYVRQKKLAREEKLRAQLPEAFDLMSRVVRAGQTMSQALLAVADEFSPPIAAEFSYCYEQQNLGLSPEDAYNDLSRRNDLIEVKLFVLALLVQQQTGGNLAEMLDKLSSVLRDRFRIRGVVKTLTAEGRMQAMILMGLPPMIFMMMMVLNPTYAMQLFLYPKLLGLTFLGEGLGAIWIRKIVNFQY